MQVKVELHKKGNKEWVLYQDDKMVLPEVTSSTVKYTDEEEKLITISSGKTLQEVRYFQGESEHSITKQILFGIEESNS